MAEHRRAVYQQGVFQAGVYQAYPVLRQAWRGTQPRPQPQRISARGEVPLGAITISGRVSVQMSEEWLLDLTN